MTAILSLTTEEFGTEISLADTKRFLSATLGESRAEKFERLVQSSGIARRQSIRPYERLRDLGTLDDDSLSSAFDVNERGQVIGISIADDGTFRPFLWERGGPMIDLNSFVPPGSNLRLENVANINDR